MSEWNKQDQRNCEKAIELGRLGVMSSELQERALACVRAFSGHADPSKCEVVGKEELGHLRSLTHAIECHEVRVVRAEREAENRRYQDMRQLANRLTTALKKLSFAAQTTGGTAGPDAALQEAIQEAGHLMSMAGASEAVDAASELIAARMELATLREQLAQRERELTEANSSIDDLRLIAREAEDRLVKATLYRASVHIPLIARQEGRS